MAYTTVQNVADYLQTTIDGTTTPSSDDVTKWIEWADSTIDEAAGTVFELTTEVSSVYVASENQVFEIWLPREFTPISSISNLYINKGTDFSTDYEEQTADTDYIIADATTGHIKLRESIRENIRAVKIDGLEHGYSSVPTIVEQLSTRLVADQFIKSGLNSNISENADGITVGPITVTKSTGQSVSFIKAMKADIETLMEQVGKFKTYIK